MYIHTYIRRGLNKPGPSFMRRSNLSPELCYTKIRSSNNPKFCYRNSEAARFAVNKTLSARNVVNANCKWREFISRAFCPLATVLRKAAAVSPRAANVSPRFQSVGSEFFRVSQRFAAVSGGSLGIFRIFYRAVIVERFSFVLCCC